MGRVPRIDKDRKIEFDISYCEIQCAKRKSNSGFYCSTPLKAICNDSYRFEMSMLHKFFINSKMFRSQKINSLLMVCPTRSSREYRYATLQPLCYIFSGIFFSFSNFDVLFPFHGTLRYSLGPCCRLLPGHALFST